MISLLFVAGVLVVISLRDFVSREVEVCYFLLMAIAVLVFCMQRTGAITLLQNMLLNTLQLTLLIACLTGYYRIRNGIAAGTFFSTKLGTGDLLFWLVSTPLFNPVNFLLWMVASLLFSLVAHWFVLLVSGKKQLTVPLAGLQAVALIVILILNQCVFNYNLLEYPLLSPGFILRCQ
jgi:hypothetical protein